MQSNSRSGKPKLPKRAKGISMSRRYFGTDGIRGLANKSPMTSEVALKVGMAAGKIFQTGSPPSPC
jgi:phosphomannomutase